LSAVDDDAMANGLASIISSNGELGWSLATGISLLVWFIYAPHCLATLATVRRETGSWKTVSFMTVYLFGLAYLMSFLAYNIASHYFG
jgi:ferrous iron transport protein B